jgi:3-oxoadipate enol-lactonase
MSSGGPDRLAFRELGTGAPLLLINGYAGTKDDWDPTFLEALGTRARVICPDNRGLGDSPTADGDLTIVTMADDVAALQRALDIEGCAVIGWSMGGFIAQELAARHPGRVSRLVLLATDPGGPEAVLAAPEVWDGLTSRAGTPREQATRLLQLLFPAPLAAQIDDEVGELVAEARAALSPAALDAQQRAIGRWHSEPAEARLRAITAPVLIAAGDADVVIPPVNSELLAIALPGARRERFADGGHAFMAQHPQELVDLIGEFLSR